MIARENFGSGSSREHAVWAILDYGFGAVIAPSFADIFYNNCFKNGMLPVRLKPDEVEYFFKNEDLDIEIDLAEQQVVAGGRKMPFEIEGFRKKLLLEGLGSIRITLQLGDYISRDEKQTPGLAPAS